MSSAASNPSFRSSRPPLLRPQPRASLTKLAEYLGAPVLRRREIIRDLREPRTFITSRYGPAEAAAIEYLLAGRNLGALDRARDALRARVAKNDNERVSIACCIAALEALPAAVATLDLEGAVLRSSARMRHRPLVVAGTRVSIRPEILVTVPRRGRVDAGALKLYFSKEFRLDGRAGKHTAGEYAAWLLSEYVRAEWSPSTTAHPHRRCHLIDVFGSRVFEAPGGHASCRRVVEAGCQEFASSWNAR